VSWPSALALLIKLEGGFVETNPPEGVTFAGIMKSYYGDWCQAHGRPAIWRPTPEAVGSYYFDEYWQPNHCGDFPTPADAVALQMVVNLPTQRARQLFQIALGVFPDSDLGPVSLGAIKNWHPLDLADRLLIAQSAHYCDVREIGDVDFKGLLDRVQSVKDAMVAGTI